MSGELQSTCPTCHGVTDACHVCHGAGTVPGVPTSIEEYAAYDRERSDLRDEILALALEKRHTRELSLGTWDNRLWLTDASGEDYSHSHYEAVLTAAGELAIRRTVREEHTPSGGGPRGASEHSGYLEPGSFEDLTRPFDFTLYAHRGSGVPHQEDLAFPAADSRLARFPSEHLGELRITRTHEKGHGLLTALRAIDLEALRESERQAIAEAPQRAREAEEEARRSIPRPSLAEGSPWYAVLGVGFLISLMIALPEAVVFGLWGSLLSGDYALRHWLIVWIFWTVQLVVVCAVLAVRSALARRGNAAVLAQYEARIAAYVKSHS